MPNTSLPEMLPAVDFDGNMYGKVERATAHHYHVLHPIIMLFLTVKDEAGNVKEIWLQKRGKDKKPYPNALTATASGHVTFQEGKTLSQMAWEDVFREAYEELDKVQIQGVRLLSTMLLNLETEGQFMFVFEGTLLNPEAIVPEECEVAQVERYTRQDILSKISAGEATPFVKEALKVFDIQAEPAPLAL